MGGVCFFFSSSIISNYSFILRLFLSDWLLERHRQTGVGPEWKRSVQRQLGDGKPYSRRDNHHGNVPSHLFSCCCLGWFGWFCPWETHITPSIFTAPIFWKNLKNGECRTKASCYLCLRTFLSFCTKNRIRLGYMEKREQRGWNQKETLQFVHEGCIINGSL